MECDLGRFDSLQDAETVKRERLAVGWGAVEILDSHAVSERRIDTERKAALAQLSEYDQELGL